MLKRKALLIVLLACCFLARNLLLSVTLSVLYLPLRLGSRVAIVLRDLAEFPHLRTQNDHLRATVGLLTQQLTRLQEMAQENTRLRQLLELRALPDVHWVSVRVVGLSPSPGTRAVILDKGARSGLRPETPMVVPEGLVGKVVTVRSQSSLAVLMTDPTFRAGCIIERSRETGVLSGSMDGRLWVSWVPATSDVVVGDVVLTSGLGGVFPKGLRIGTVRRVGLDSTRLYRTVEVAPAATMSRLEEAFCQGAP